jgi:uncharacterized protein
MSERGVDPIDLSWQQQAVVDFLSRGDSYGTAGEQVEQIVTHCSIIFLIGNRAYKLKRAIRFASLDYTTRQRREQACQAELVLNRRTAPELYLAVRSINRGEAGRLSFDVADTPVDHVVVMRRFEQETRLDVMAEAGQLTTELMQGLGHTIARFHEKASPTRAFGGRHGVRGAVEENHRELARVAPILRADMLPALRGKTIAVLEALALLLDERQSRGKVRRCHGDLRLANICLFAGRPILFDCIEFSDELSCIDTLYDLAFLLMDLHVRGQGDLAEAVLAGYQQTAGEADEGRLLPLFLSMRAATRTWALAAGALRQSDPCEAQRRLASARRHLAASYCFLRHPPPWFHRGLTWVNAQTGME